jgi:hypothetical protein
VANHVAEQPAAASLIILDSSIVAGRNLLSIDLLRKLDELIELQK